MKFRPVVTAKAIAAASLYLALASLPLAAEPEGAKCTGKSGEPLVSLLPLPPCETCEKTKAELSELEQIAKDASDERKAKAKNDVVMSLAQFLGGAGIPFDAGQLSQCEAGYFKAWRKEEKSVLDAAKIAFCRVRPFSTPGNALHADADGMSANDNSYPSGHSAYGAVMGLLLADMLPEKTAEIDGRIEDYAYSRLVLGVHFRSDVEAGKLLGAAIGASLLAKPGFDAEFANAKSCVRKAVGLP